ncbi:hypothetical protein [Nocardia bhagyanarayanae]|uniref:Uncharacterized protein n=1 Tax=Nocardia bhagyanarayanae TaxID=1215925 RepID=A0A543F7Q9_9NOCA|nr:hypothetical protein [Nocardia bhagyanarayanae]TQM29867.1 hypothetical protein FB390_1480 [Nocardia bhagyanarayanae]
MTIENTVNEPTVVYDDDVMITMRGVSDSVGLPYTVNPVELADREVMIELREGPAGPVGPEGDPAWPWLWEGDIADLAALTALGLGMADARKAWRVVSENAIYYWTGLELIAFDNAFRRVGRPGAPNQLTGAALTGATGSTAAASMNGTAPAQRLEITFPRGETGDVGDPGAAGRIQDAADVLIDEVHPLGQDHVLAWDAAIEKFRPAPSPNLAGPWIIGEKQFTGGTNMTDPFKVVAAITIPAQPMAWRPIVEGSAYASAANGTRCDFEVRIGGPEGALVGYARGHAVSAIGFALIAPTFQYPIQPGSTAAVVAANQTATLYVIVRRVVGTANYRVYTTNAQLIVSAQPV